MLSKGQVTKQKILTDAAEVFQRQGFGATSIHDLLVAAGVTKGSLYFHFPGKEAIGAEVLRREAAAFMVFLDQALTGATPAACLDHFFEQALRKHQKTGFVGGCLFGNTALEASDTSPLYTQIVDAVFRQWAAKIEQKIDEAQQLGLIRRDVEAANLAQMVVAAIEGGIMQSRLQKSPEPMRQGLETLRTMLELKL